MMSFRSIIYFAATLAIAAAFSPSDKPTARSTWSASTSYVPMKRVGYASPPPSTHYRCNTATCRMSSDAESEAAKLKEQAAKLREEAAAAAGVSVDELMTKSSDGTLYDDETDVAQAPKENISNAMKERLRREASSGLDSNKSQTNVILYVSVGVAILVILGGQGILY
jgi:hypothetical protein